MPDLASSRDCGPVGKGDYEVQQGECLGSVAKQFGFTWQALWMLPENRELRRTRKDPNVLFPGDRVTIPPRRLKQIDAATDQTHTYVRSDVPAKFVMRFYEDGKPRAGESYTFIVDRIPYFGTLDSNGQLAQSIAPDAKSGEVIFAEGERIPITFGTLDPISEISGVQGRLRNLGFAPGPVDGILGPRTQNAIREFQKKTNLKITGQLDDATRAKLTQMHGS